MKDVILEYCKCACEQAIITAIPIVKEVNPFVKGLEIGIIIIMILLVILALIIGFSKLKDLDKRDEEDTYY